MYISRLINIHCNWWTMVDLVIASSKICNKKSYNDSTFQTVKFPKINNTVFRLISAGPQIGAASLTLRSECGAF